MSKRSTKNQVRQLREAMNYNLKNNGASAEYFSILLAKACMKRMGEIAAEIKQIGDSLLCDKCDRLHKEWTSMFRLREKAQKVM